MTEHVMMALGKYRFSVQSAAYNELKRVTPFRWKSVDRAGRRPSLEYMGPGKETIEISGIIIPSYRGGLRQLDAMRAEAARGKPLNLTGGLGHVWGLWCIESIEETQTLFHSGGAPRKQSFRLTLSAYGKDR